MQTVLLVVYLLIVIALVVIVLLQRSEGGGFSSSNNANFMTARGSKNALTRLTAILASCFFIMAMILVIMDSHSNSVNDILESIPSKKEASASATPSGDKDHSITAPLPSVVPTPSGENVQQSSPNLKKPSTLQNKEQDKGETARNTESKSVSRPVKKVKDSHQQNELQTEKPA